MTNIETTTADFCNGSLSDDQARIKDGVSLIVLINEACDSFDATHEEGESNYLFFADFEAYYKILASEITGTPANDISIYKEPTN